jgi:dihydrofolate reductase
VGKVVVGMTLSLDGYVTDRNGDAGVLYPDFKTFVNSPYLRESVERTGAVVMGRSTYDMANGDFIGYEFQVPIFVLTHDVPAEVASGENDNLTFTFVTDGIESAVAQAKAAAGERDVTIVGGASTIQQCLKAGLADELHVDLMPLILGGGLRLFEHLEDAQIKLEKLKVMESALRTHLKFRVVR